jgi:transcriptional regulator with XRE-family HTH domain
MTRTPDQLRPIVTALIAARRRAGLSQRALSDKVGLAQSHISKIERAAVDPQISSLLEIARVLSLEFMLVPKQLVPALQALKREATPDPRRLPSVIDRELTLLARHARELVKRFPDLHVLSDISAAADELRVARLDQSPYAEARFSLDAASAILNRLRERSRARSDNEQIVAARIAAEELKSIARALRTIRNSWSQRDTGSSQSPAYRLDDSDA